MIAADRVVKTIEGMCLLGIDDLDPKRFGDLVYTFCHISSGTCGNPHPEWEQAFLEMEELVNRELDSPINKEARRKREEETP